MVVPQHSQVEWPITARINTQSNNVCERQQHRLELLMGSALGARVLDGRESRSVYQLEGVESSTYSPQDFPSATEFHGINQDRQYNQPLIHQQARRHSLSSFTGTGYGGLDLVPGEQDNEPSTTYSGCSQQDSGFRASPTVLKNQWMIKPHIFQQIHQTWGPFSIDLFADRTIKQLPNYVSWMPDLDALYPDALSIPWSNLQNPFANPPWNLISRVLNKIRRERLPLMTLVVPY